MHRLASKYTADILEFKLHLSHFTVVYCHFTVVYCHFTVVYCQLTVVYGQLLFHFPAGQFTSQVMMVNQTLVHTSGHLPAHSSVSRVMTCP